LPYFASVDVLFKTVLSFSLFLIRKREKESTKEREKKNFNIFMFIFNVEKQNFIFAQPF